MDIFNVLSLIGGLCLFLFGMNVMGESLERRAGGKLRELLGKLTTNKLTGFLTGLGVTAVIQSSSATTVMVVGFVNSGLMSLKQAINVIMGANVGTTVTAWILSLSGIDSGNVFVQLLKPSSFTPVLALLGVILYMFVKDTKKKDTGLILLGFATLMFGMEAMSDAVSGLRDVPQFQQIFLLFTNPILGVLAGAVLTGIIQSSSASVGILQALASTGQVTFGAAIPIIMGQNIGTCVTALLSSVCTNKNARRAALVHLSFNVVGTVIWCAVFSIVKAVFAPAVLSGPATVFNIAVAHSAFNIACTALLLPCSSLLEKLAYRLIPEDKKPEELEELDERLLTTPPIALQRCRSVMLDMAKSAVVSLHDGLELVEKYDADTAKSIRSAEELTDHYEDILGSYLVKLSTLRISGTDSTEAAMYLKMISDFERIADHSVGMLEAVEEMRSKGVNFSENAQAELKVLTSAVGEIVDLTLTTFVYNDVDCAKQVEPLQQVIAHLKETMRTRHILRLQNEKCSIEAGFVWSDLLTNLERTADHCSNIAGCVIDIAGGRMNLHSSLRDLRSKNEGYRNHFDAYKAKYSL